MKTHIITKSSRETIHFAKELLKNALRKSQESAPFDRTQDNPLIFYLEGELGAGKTHFAKGLAEGLGIKDNITSPTFVLMKKYEIPKGYRVKGIGYRVFYHIDCYRIYDAEDARQIGLDTILENPRAIVAVEWAERVKEIIPKPYWKLTFQHINDEARKIIVKNVQR